MADLDDAMAGYEPEAFTRSDWLALQTDPTVDDEPPVDLARHLTDTPATSRAEADAWRQHAACHPRHKPDRMTPAEWTGIFFPARDETLRAARAICASCPVVDDCLTDGLMDRRGIRGGQSERQRRTIRKTRAA